MVCRLAISEENISRDMIKTIQSSTKKKPSVLITLYYPPHPHPSPPPHLLLLLGADFLRHCIYRSAGQQEEGDKRLMISLNIYH